MWKAVLAGIVALAFAAPTSALAETPASGYSLQSHGGNPRLEAGISRFKSALRLTPEQHKHWPRVEAALRSLSRENDTAEEKPGFFRRVGNRAAEMAINGTAMRRLVSAAQPLMKSLDQDQKREAMTLARAMGFASLAARFE